MGYVRGGCVGNCAFPFQVDNRGSEQANEQEARRELQVSLREALQASAETRLITGSGTNSQEKKKTPRERRARVGFMRFSNGGGTRAGRWVSIAYVVGATHFLGWGQRSRPNSPLFLPV